MDFNGALCEDIKQLIVQVNLNIDKLVTLLIFYCLNFLNAMCRLVQLVHIKSFLCSQNNNVTFVINGLLNGRKGNVESLNLSSE